MPKMFTLKARIRQQKTRFFHLSRRVLNPESLVLSQSTPFQVISKYHGSQLRYYAAAHKRYKEPLVFVAPLAVNMAIYDLYPYRSLVQHFQLQGFDVYLVDWGTFTFQDRYRDFLFFIDDCLPHYIKTVCEHSQSEKISLHGWSMGGIFALLYSALAKQSHVKNLIILGSPIDSYASGRIGKLFKTVNQLLTRHAKIRHTIENIPEGLIHTPGFINALGFKIIDPAGWLNSCIQLFKYIDNEKFLREHTTVQTFLNHMNDYPGAINKDMIFKVWLKNPLKTGSIHLKDRLIDLKNIECSLLLGAGTTDQIVTEAAIQPLSQLTNSADVSFTAIPGGHIGLMSSQASANEFWPKLTEWLVQRSSRIKDTLWLKWHFRHQ